MPVIKRNMNVIHPGAVLKLELIKTNGLTVSEIASTLGVSRQTVSNILNEKAEITPEMALRIATVFGGTPEIWLHLQSKYNLEKAAKKLKHFKLKPYRYKHTA